MAVKERWLKANPINITTEDAVSSLLELFKADERIKLVYLFGSRSAKSASSDSDIDFALYADENFSWQDLYLLIERCGHRPGSSQRL
jgi:predicted nucleotidyltransferase